MKCPICTTPDLLMSERLGIEVDYCPQCRGVWLDRGELDKIIERSTRELAQAAPAPSPSPQAPQPAPPYYDNRHGSRSGHHDEHQGYRKKSIWKELFD
ncbi:MAG: zf-TFIIB domain-containing protein [Rhodoferax sp.]